MLVFDASSILHAWDNYSPENFPPVWEWLDTLIDRQEISMAKVALDEVNHMAPDCHARLRVNNILQMDVDNTILQESLRIKRLLGIENDQYHPNGVDENDVIIIATALTNSLELVSNEALQNNLPNNIKKYKIPAVCNMEGVRVTCFDFVKYFKRSDVVFG